jgi:predicted transcriptional regulator
MDDRTREHTRRRVEEVEEVEEVVEKVVEKDIEEKDIVEEFVKSSKSKRSPGGLENPKQNRGEWRQKRARS